MTVDRTGVGTILHVRDGWPLDVQLEITIECGAGRYVGQSQRVAAEELPALEHLVEQAEMPGAASHLVADDRPVPAS
jgi:hypothetical protein